MKRQVLKCFKIYKESIFSIDNDLRFWRYFLEIAIEKNPQNSNDENYQASFCVDDLQHDKIFGSRKCYHKLYSIKSSELGLRRVEFFNWVMNLSVLKAYNSLEILILQCVQLVYFPSLEDPLDGRKQMKKIETEIKNTLIEQGMKFDTTNNAHLLNYLRLKSSKIDSFLSLAMNNDLTTTWAGFFTLISILRNAIAHSGMVVNNDVKNQLKATAKDLFERYFSIQGDINSLPILTPKDENFNEFIKAVNNLSINICKFILDEKDLSFLDLK